MEERMIDDEYGRGVRMKKTKDGFVDVTDELTEGLTEGLETEQEPVAVDTEDEGEEIAFEFPTFDEDEDDEELVGLTPEEAAALKKRREEEAAQRKADYERICQEGDELLKTGSFKAAELKFEKALALDDEATDASVGYWRAKTVDFTQSDILVEEYAEAGIESLEYDLGYQAVENIKRDFKTVFQTRVKELTEEEKPLAEKVEQKQESRRKILSERVKRSAIAFVCVTLPTAALLALAIVIGLKNFSTRENEYVLPTILLIAGFFLSFIAFIVCTNKFLNNLRMRRANEKLSSTEDGARLEKIREYKEIYEYLAGGNAEAENA